MNNTKNNLLENKIVVFLLAIMCCLLWGSAFPSIKIGYNLFGIDSTDIMSQILFAGIRFFLAGIFTIIFGSILSAIFLSEWNTISVRYLVALILVSIGIFIVNKNFGVDNDNNS